MPKEIEILESDSQVSESEKVDSFDSILFSSGTEGTVGTLLEGVNGYITDNNKSDLVVEESTVSSLESSDDGDRHPPEPSPAFTSSPNLNLKEKADFYSGYWHCKTCSHKDDGPGMKAHICKGVKK